MDQIVNNPYDAEDFHNQQMEHYGIRTGRPTESRQPLRRAPAPMAEAPAAGDNYSSSSSDTTPSDGTGSLPDMTRYPRVGDGGKIVRMLSNDLRARDGHVPRHVGVAGRAGGWSLTVATQQVANRVMDGVIVPSRKAALSARDKAKEFSAIVRMTPAERAKFAGGRAMLFDRSLEEWRRQHPAARPDHQKTYLVEKKQERLMPGIGWEDLRGPRDFDVLLEEYGAHRRRAAADHEQYLDDVAVAVLAGQVTGQHEADVGPDVELTSEERRSAEMDHLRAGGNPRDKDWSHYRGFTKVQQTAYKVSKMMDPIKRKHKKSWESDMSFGMMDIAPSGALHKCVQCKWPTKTYLKDTLCARCRGVERGRD